MVRRSIVSIGQVLLVALLLASFTSAAQSALVQARSPAPVQRPQRSFSPNTSSQANWPQFGYEAAHDGFNPLETTLSPSNVGQLQQAWSFFTGSTNDAGNVVYDNGVLYAASAKGKLFAIDASTGTRLWIYPTGTGYSTSGSVAAVDSGMVFTVCTLPPSGYQGTCALNASTGALAWSYMAPGPTSYAETAPVVADGKVYFGACGTSCAYIALNESDGSVVWSKDQSGGCSLNGGSPPAIYKGELFAGIGCTNGSVIALSAKNGRTIWSQGVYRGSVENVSAVDDLVGVTGSSFVGVLSAKTGHAFWNNFDCGSPGMPAFAYQDVFMPCNGSLYAYKAHAPGGAGSGVRVWSTGGNQAAIANGVIYSLLNPSPGDIPGAVAATNGGAIWFSSSASTYGLPIVVNGVVYGSCNRTAVCAWALPSSNIRRPGMVSS